MNGSSTPSWCGRPRPLLARRAAAPSRPGTIGRLWSGVPCRSTRERARPPRRNGGIARAAAHTRTPRQSATAARSRIAARAAGRSRADAGRSRSKRGGVGPRANGDFQCGTQSMGGPTRHFVNKRRVTGDPIDDSLELHPEFAPVTTKCANSIVTDRGSGCACWRAASASKGSPSRRRRTPRTQRKASRGSQGGGNEPPLVCVNARKTRGAAAPLRPPHPETTHEFRRRPSFRRSRL